MPPLVKKLIAVAVLIILVNIGFVKYGQASFNATFEQLAKAFSENNATLPRRAALPEPIQTYIDRSGAAKHPYKTVVLQFEGEYYKKPGGKPYAMHTLALLRPTPDMLWAVRMESAVVTFNALETYHNGRSKMKISLFGLIPTGQFDSPLFTRSELTHILAFAVFNPELFRCRCIDYKTVDSRHVEATIHDNNLSASALFTFNDAGDIVRVESSDRTRPVKGEAVRTDWRLSIGVYQTFGTLRLPATMEESWIIDSKPFNFMHYKLTGARTL
ncbi:DUF6544 family protein [Hydrogenimonas sp. SS33]|uniref:DUF6544 family protein n=1 Tax=Hydrogenimonas leucolamina TaxID=2954236 RepID=UPI00336BD97F